MRQEFRTPLLIVLLLLLALPVLAQTGKGRIRVIVESADLRLEPDRNSRIVTSIPMGAVLDFTVQSGEWFLVELPRNQQGITITGYLHLNDIEVLAQAPRRQQATPPPPPAQTQSQPRPQTPPPAYPTAYRTGKRGGFKILGGVSLSNVSYKDDPDVTEKPGNRMGIIGGIGYEFLLASSLGVEVDVLYHQRGLKYEEMRDGSVQDGEDTFTYGDNLVLKTETVSVPILLKYRFSPGPSPYIAAGFEGAMVLSNDADYTFTTYKNGSVDDEEKTSTDIKEYTKSMDYGLVFGAGLELALGGANLVIDGRYYMGLANMLDSTALGEQSSDDDWIKSKAIVVMLGLKF